MERRKHYRIELYHPLSCTLTILKQGDSIINRRFGLIKVTDVSLGGLAFESQINIPFRTDILFNFSIVLNRINYQLKGIILRKTAILIGFSYGVQFLVDESKRESINNDLRRLNNLNELKLINKEYYEYYAS